MLSTDPIDLKRDDTGDVVVPPVLVAGPEGVRQQLLLNLQDFKGEWFLNRDVGPAWLANDIVPEEEAILGNPYDETALRAALQEVILQTVAVTEIISFAASFSPGTREVTVRCEVRFVFEDLTGTLTIAETF